MSSNKRNRASEPAQGSLKRRKVSNDSPAAKKSFQKRRPPAQGGSDPFPERRDFKKGKTPAHAEQISRYHANEKQLSQADALRGNPVAQFRLRQKQQDLESYQDASITGALSGGETGKWLSKELQKLRKDGDEPVRLLDVGALTGTAYDAYDWIEATSIDINPRSAKVIKADFQTYPTPPSLEDAYDVVALSLVLNFVGGLEERGEMLRLTLDHLKPDGMLYLVLPVACVKNSRYIDHARLRGILKAVGYDVLVQHDSAKLTSWLLRRSETPSAQKRWQKKLLDGKLSGDRNNFAIVLR